MANNLGIGLDDGARYGQSAIRLVATDPSIRDIAWRGATLALYQRALLNVASVPQKAETKRIPIRLAYSLPGPVMGRFTRTGQLLPDSEGAVSDKLEEQVPEGTPHAQVHIANSMTPEYLLVQNADALVDEYHLRRLIYKNSRISYRGGRVRIEMVYFVNCQFEISQTKEGERFIEALLESVPMSFTSGIE
jgi:hypothetical protein